MLGDIVVSNGQGGGTGGKSTAIPRHVSWHSWWRTACRICLAANPYGGKERTDGGQAEDSGNQGYKMRKMVQMDGSDDGGTALWPDGAREAGDGGSNAARSWGRLP